MPDTTIYLRDYQFPAFTIDAVSLIFDLYDDLALVTATIRLIRRHSGALHLLGEELELVSLHLNGVPLQAGEYQLQEDGLVINDCPDEMTLTVMTRIRPQDNTQLSGLYKSNHLFCTQCEAEGFRRITYFLDRPDVLATYTTKIIAD